MVLDIIDFCQQFYASIFIPILYFHWPHEIQWSCPSILKEMSTQNTVMEEKIKFHKNPKHCIVFLGNASLQETAAIKCPMCF